MKKITITGDLGSGKSVVSNLLANKLNCKVMSTGMLQRQLADKYNMSTLELNKYAESHPEIDEIIDNNLREIGNNNEYCIVDSRLAWFFIPHSLKIYLTVDIDIAAQRIINDFKRKNETYISFEKAKEDILKRKESENMRYLTLYNADCANMENFDIIIDTSDADPEEIVNTIMNLYNSSEDISVPKYWISPRQLMPLQNVSELSDRDSLRVKENVKNKGYDLTNPIIAIRYHNDYFVYDGHRILSACLLNKIALVPITVIHEESILPNGLDIKTYLRDSYKLNYINNWEDMHQIKFSSYYEAGDFSY